MTNRVLLVDDEPAVVNLYRIALREKYAVEVATDPLEALKLIEEDGPFAVVVSDMKMPGMNGIELLGKIREQHKQTIGILMTGHPDANTAIRAINEGEVFRFLDKANSGALLEGALDAAIRQHELLKAEAEMLSSTLSGGVCMLIQVLSLAMPEAFGLAHEAKTLCRSIAKKLEAEPLWQIEVAAMLMRVGCVALPNDVVTCYLSGDPLEPDQKSQIAETPKIGYELVNKIPRMQGVAELIRAQHDPPTDKTPIGARILRVVGEFQRLQLSSGSLSATLWTLQDESLYDRHVVQKLSEIVSVDRDQKYVMLDDLKPGMILESHIERPFDKGVIIAKGTEVHEAMIQKLCMLRSDGVSISEPIRVLVASSQAPAEVAAGCGQAT